MSMNPKTVPHGSLKSAITFDPQSIGLSEVRFDGQAVYWLEAGPQDQRRNVIARVLVRSLSQASEVLRGLREAVFKIIGQIEDYTISSFRDCGN
jgi:hypothetical protein